MSGPTPVTIFTVVKSQLGFRIPEIKSSFAGQTVVVTGGNAGLGRAAVEQLVQLNAEKVILTARTPSKGEEAKQTIEQATGRKGVVEVWDLDLADYASVKAFANRIEKLDRLDAVLENAGIRPVDQSVAEGHELALTTNVISTFLLAYLLLPKLRETAAKHNTTARLTFVGSALHRFSTLAARKSDGSLINALDKQQLTTGMLRDARYNDTKLLLQMYGEKLAVEHAAKHGESVCITVMNPGYCISNLARTSVVPINMARGWLARSTEDGGKTLVDSIALDKVAGRHGHYIDDCQVKQSVAWIRSDEGKSTKERFWKDLNAVLDGVSPGLTSSLQAKI